MQNQLPARIPTYVRDKIPQAIMPVEYTAACKSLEKCLTIEDAKYWSNAADALASWARIYQNDEAGRAAKRLKAQALRKMSILADELQPAGVKGLGKGRGLKPGPYAA